MEAPAPPGRPSWVAVSMLPSPRSLNNGTMMRRRTQGGQRIQAGSQQLLDPPRMVLGWPARAASPSAPVDVGRDVKKRWPRQKGPGARHAVGCAHAPRAAARAVAVGLDRRADETAAFAPMGAGCRQRRATGMGACVCRAARSPSRPPADRTPPRPTPSTTVSRAQRIDGGRVRWSPGRRLGVGTNTPRAALRACTRR